MAKEEWGVKRICPETGKRFYDLGKDPVVSPYTGQDYPLSFFTETGKKTSMADKADASAAAKASEELEDDLDVDVLEEDENGADLGDDVLDDEDDGDTVPLEEVAGVAAPDEDG